jgi:tetratricopeptide (TPR) repeat protein
MKKGGKRRQGKGGSRPSFQPAADISAVARQAQAALAAGNVDTACEVLAQVRRALPTIEDPALRDLCRRAYVQQAYARWERPARALESLERALEATPEVPVLHRLRSHLLRRLGRTKPAVAALAEAARLAPEDAVIAYEFGLVQLAGGERDAGAIEPPATLDHPAATRLAALVAAFAGNPARAERAVAGATQPLDRQLSGMLLLAEGQTARAVRELEMVTVESTDAPLPAAARALAYLYLGIAHVQRRQLGAAAGALEQAQQLGAPETEVHSYLEWVNRQQALEAALSGDMSGAAAHFRQVEHLSGPAAADARRLAATALIHHGQVQAQQEAYEAAIDAWYEALDLTPRDMTLRRHLAVALERAGRAEEAIPHWQEVLRQLPRVGARVTRSGAPESAEEAPLDAYVRAVAHRHLAELYLDQDEVEQALTHLERAVTAVPADADTRRQLGQLLLDEGRTKQAVPHFRRIVESGDAQVTDYVELGASLLATGQLGEGRIFLERATEIEPENALAQITLGTALMRQVLDRPNAPAAVEDAQRAVDLLPEKVQGIALVALGAAQLAKGDLRTAKKTLRKGITRAIDKAAAAVRVGHVYWSAGEQDLARKAWAEAMKKAARAPETYSLLAEAWAIDGDAEQCRACLLRAAEHHDLQGLIQTAERLREVPEAQRFLRQVLHEAAEEAASLTQRVYLVEAAFHNGDVAGARTLLNATAREAIQIGDEAAIDGVMNVDTAHRLLDRKTAGQLLAWLQDIRPAMLPPEYLPEPVEDAPNWWTLEARR